MTIDDYATSLTNAEREMCALLDRHIATALPDAVGKVWHGHPVWFLDTNPVVGYHRQKGGLRVLFWSGQSFVDTRLTAVGKFKAAGMPVAAVEDFDSHEFEALLQQARMIQWDYANLPKRRSLDKLTDF